MTDDISLFDIIDNVIVALEQRVSELEWELAEEARVEYLKAQLDSLHVRRDSGEVLLPRF